MEQTKSKQKISDFMADKKNRTKTITIVTVMVIILIQFFTTIAIAGFDLGTLQTPNFWFRFGSTAIIGLITRSIFLNRGITEGNSIPEIEELKGEISNAGYKVDNEHLTEKLNMYIEEENRKKIFKAAKNKVHIILNRRFITKKNKAKWLKIKSDLYRIGYKADNKSDEEMLETILGQINPKYNKVSISVLFSDMSAKYANDDDLASPNAAFYASKMIMPIFGALATTAFLTAFTFQINTSFIQAALSFINSLIAISIHSFSGYKFGYYTIDVVKRSKLNLRINFLGRFFAAPVVEENEDTKGGE